MIEHSIEINPQMSGFWYVVNKGRIFLNGKGEIPQGTLLSLGLPVAEHCLQIGLWQQQPIYLLIHQDSIEDESKWHTARALLTHPESIWFELAARATQLALFLQTHRYCGQCGCAMHLVSWELAMLCHKCGHRVYPRISPCILVAVVKDQQILLARSKRHKPGFFSILAGFVESGETLEQAAVREVGEEVGVKINNLRYVGSQPWPFPHSLMAGFMADYVSGDIRCQPNEIEEAHWFDLTSLPEIPPVQTLSGQMIAQAQSEIAGKSGLNQ